MKQNNSDKKVDFIIFNNNNSISPNIYKIELMLIELGVTYESHSVEEYIKNNPNNKRIPALIDNTFEEANILYEHGSVLIYLANKYNRNLLPNFRLIETESNNKYHVLTKSVWQVVNLGPQFPVNINCIVKFNTETEKQLKLLNDRLSANQYLGGSQFSIADISNSVWVSYLLNNLDYKFTKEQLLTGSNNQQRFSNLYKWLELINQRDSFKKLNNLMIDDLKVNNNNNSNNNKTHNNNINNSTFEITV